MKKFGDIELNYLVNQKEENGNETTVKVTRKLPAYGTKDRPWFRAVDVAEMLDYSKREDGSYKTDGMTACLEGSEKIVGGVETSNNTAHIMGGINTANSIGGIKNKAGNPNETFISENGLYRIVRCVDNDNINL